MTVSKRIVHPPPTKRNKKERMGRERTEREGKKEKKEEGEKEKEGRKERKRQRKRVKEIRMNPGPSHQHVFPCVIKTLCLYNSEN